MTNNKAVLDIYGNFAAIQCPACGNVYILSGALNVKTGRPCPHCKNSIAIVKNAQISVAELVIWKFKTGICSA